MKLKEMTAKELIEIVKHTDENGCPVDHCSKCVLQRECLDGASAIRDVDEFLKNCIEYREKYMIKKEQKETSAWKFRCFAFDDDGMTIPYVDFDSEDEAIDYCEEHSKKSVNASFYRKVCVKC